MLQNLPGLLAPPVLERVTLVLNHVLATEPVATARLQPHAGRGVAIELDGWPALLPRLPTLMWRITPAGLLEWGGLEPEGGAELQVHVDASNPALMVARALAGERPSVRVEGDAQLAADVGWLLQNLRWDVAADLERVLPRPVAHQLVQLGGALAGAWRAALKAASPLVERFGTGSSAARGGRSG
jgi:ubiquinone biosynthesis protein UbiJ